MTGGMMFKGTPGPWFMQDGKDDGWIIAKDDAIVCMMNAGLSHEEMSDTEKHDSNLIMAAPELLEALIGALKEMEGLYKGIAPHGEFADRSDAVKSARAAIAKALGETK